MKYTNKMNLTHTVFFALFALLLVGCNPKSGKNCKKTVVDERDVFVYFTAAEMRATATPQIMEAQVLKHPGKIFLMGDYIFLTEKNDGVHIIDNRDPANPKTLKYIRLKGNWDLAMKGNMLYADSYSDLLVFDVKNPENPKLIRRVEDVFNWDNVIGRFKDADMEKELVKDVQHIKREYLIACDENIDIATKNEATGQAGSMTRFCVSSGFLYTVDDYELYTFSIQVPDNPILANKQRVDDKIETIFAHGNRLFIGGLQGVYIYDKTQAAAPAKIDHFKHLESCDPVIIEGNFAYLTTRVESTCRRGKNMLMVLDVKDFTKAALVAEFPMQHPYGLGIKDNRLYLAEGEHGLKVFDISDNKTIDQHLVARDSSYHCYDVIPHFYKPLLVMVGNDGLYEYDISSPDSLKRLGALKAFGN